MKEVFVIAHQINKCLQKGYPIAVEDIDKLIVAILKLEYQPEK
jgi:hypothetical protein